MTTTAADLLAAICRDPLSTTLRLVTADLMEEEEDHARAEFVRVQCELADTEWKRPSKSGFRTLKLRSRHEFLRRRELELFTWKNIEAWFGHHPWLRTYVDPSEYEQATVCSMLVRRGFVEAVTLSEADFLGSPCPECGETGITRPYCPACTGTGRVGGHGPALVAAAPITEVTLTDKEPHQYEGKCYWYDDQREMTAVDDPRSFVSRELFVLMIRNGWSFDYERGESTLTTPDAARLALLRAAVDLARSAAGLPALVWPEGDA